jgi:hypothetical protein
VVVADVDGITLVKEVFAGELLSSLRLEEGLPPQADRTITPTALNHIDFFINFMSSFDGLK